MDKVKVLSVLKQLSKTICQRCIDDAIKLKEPSVIYTSTCQNCPERISITTIVEEVTR